MPRITDIKPQRKAQRFNVFIDGRFAVALSSETLVKEGLRIDQEISKEQIEKLAKENEFLNVYDRALNFFSYRPRSEKELNNWFKRKKIGEETQKLICQKLNRLGLLNDEEFAKWWIDQRIGFRPMGKSLLKMELKQKGISEDLIAKLLNCYIVKGLEFELAKKITEKKLKTLRHLPSRELKQKLSAFLARRGFSWETIKEILEMNSEIGL